jgi:hypothetical protein
MSELGSVLNQLHRVQGLVVQLDNKIDSVGFQVNHVSATQEQTRDQLAQLRRDFLVFVQQAQLTANVQRAETRLGTLQDQVEHEFGHHKVVRRTAVGMLQAFDVGLVSDEVVSSVAEELMIQTPRYWLAPALVALAAWSADDPGLCSRAVAEAFRRAPARTSLFFALILRRQDRAEAALRWLRHYLSTLDPQALGRDFAVVLEAIAHGAFGPAAQELTRQTLQTWQESLQSDDAITEAQIARWRQAIDSHVPTTPTTAYPTLAKVSPQWSQLDTCLRAASAHVPLAASYSAMLREEPAGMTSVEDAIDDVLDRLVSEYDEEELPLRREVATTKAVIDCQGDLDQAQRVAEASTAALDDTLDYLTIQTESALNPDGIGVSRATQRLAVASCHGWFRSAHERFSGEYRKALPSDVQARFDSNHTIGARVFQLPPWQGSFTRALPELEKDLVGHWERHTRSFVEALRFNWQNHALIAVAVLFFVLLFLVAANPVFGIVATLVAGGVWALVIYVRHESSRTAVAKAEHWLAEAQSESLGQLRDAAAQLTDWQTEFEAADAKEAEVRAVLDRLAVGGSAPTPYERRPITDRSTP